MKKNPLEWIVFAASLLLVLFVIGYLVVTSITQEETPPDLFVELGEATSAGGGNSAGFNIPFTIKNRGNQSAADVRLEVTLITGEEEVETNEVTLPLVPYQSERKGSLIFQQNPAEGRLVPEIKSYQEP